MKRRKNFSQIIISPLPIISFLFIVSSFPIDTTSYNSVKMASLGSDHVISLGVFDTLHFSLRGLK